MLPSDGQPGEQGIFLEHDAAVDPGTGDRPAVDQQRPGAGPQEAAEQIQQRAFAAAGRADDADELALADIEIYLIERSHAGTILHRHAGDANSHVGQGKGVTVEVAAAP